MIEVRHSIEETAEFVRSFVEDHPELMAPPTEAQQVYERDNSNALPSFTRLDKYETIDAKAKEGARIEGIHGEFNRKYHRLWPCHPDYDKREERAVLRREEGKLRRQRMNKREVKAEYNRRARDRKSGHYVSDEQKTYREPSPFDTFSAF